MRRSAATMTLMLVVPLAGCAASESTPRPSPAPAPSSSPTSVTTPGEGTLTPGFNEPPDSEIAPDSTLSGADITRLLRVTATDAGSRASCVPADVSALIDSLDAAAGHRYGRLVLTNTSQRTCSVAGYPGIGARGEWGNTFQIAAEQVEPRAGTATVGVVMLDPGDAAFANVEWTGELAGAINETVSMLAIQLARSQDAFGMPAVGAVAADSGDLSGTEMPLDIGMLTTVRIGPMQAASS